MTTATTTPNVVFFPPKFIAEVKAATDDCALKRALERRDLTEAKRIFRHHLENREYTSPDRLEKIRALHERFTQLCASTI